MHSKVPIKKGVNVVLVVSMIGMGSFLYIPEAYASGVENGKLTAVPLEQTSSSNSLSKLEIEGVQLDQPFDSNVKEYSATVENNVGSIKLLAEPSETNSIVTVNGQPLISDPYMIHTGENIFTITVDDGTNSPNTYILKVIRKQNSNDFLQNIQLSKGKLSPVFNPSITSYHVQFPNEVNELTVTPLVFENTSTIMVNSTKVTEKGVTVQIPVGTSKVTILLTAENGDKKVYTIEVNRAAKKPETNPTKSNGTNRDSFSKGKSGLTNMKASGSQGFQFQNNTNQVQKVSKATLSKLIISKGTWNKTFSSTKFTYHIAENADVNEVTISTDPSYSDAVISINGDTSNAIQLGNNKKTNVPIVVTKGDEHKTYVLVFDKKIKQNTVTNDVSVESTSSTTETNPQDSAMNTSAKVSSFNESNGSTTTSWWRRLIDKIRSFF